MKTVVVKPNYDDDNDGVKNFFDACPETPAGTTVDPRGCEIIIDADLMV